MAQIFPLHPATASQDAFPTDEALPPGCQGLPPFRGAQAASGPGPDQSLLSSPTAKALTSNPPHLPCISYSSV